MVELIQVRIIRELKPHRIRQRLDGAASPVKKDQLDSVP